MVTLTHPVHTTRFTSALGPMILAATDQGLAGVWFVGQRHAPDTAGWITHDTHPVLRAARRQLEEYMAGTRSRFDLPLDLRAGTPFQQSVWRALLAIPYGATVRYADIGQQVGKPGAARAVGAAVGRNPISLVVPCHRVMGSDGSLTGYAGGLDRKQALLRTESTSATQARRAPLDQKAA